MDSQRHFAISFLALGILLLTMAISPCDALLAQEQAPLPSRSAPSISLLDAVRSTLVNHTLLRIQEEQVNINRGIKQQASGQFDTLLGSSVGQTRTNTPLTLYLQQQALLIGISTNNLVTNLTTYNASAGKLFRSGVSASIVLGVTRDLDNVTQGGGVNGSHVGLMVNIPLLRGLGNEAVAAQEGADSLEVEASLLDFDQLVAQLMANAASSYWNFVAAHRGLRIAQDSEQRGREYVENVQAFIDADRVPRSDIHEVTANLAARTATRIAAEHQVELARQQLALDMGLPPEQMLSLPDARDDFPSPENQPLPSNGSAAMQYYLGESLRRRADFLAAGKRYAEARRLLAGAKNQLLPSLDLSVSTGYSGLQEGKGPEQFFQAPYRGVQGVDAALALNYTFPPRNDIARGQVVQNAAALNQALLRKTQIAEGITAAVSVAVDGVRAAAEQVRKTGESVNSFQLALTAERERYRMAISSVVEVLTVEDALTTALTNQVQAGLSFSLALTQLRLATGTLFELNKPVQIVDGSIFLTIPFAAVPQGH
ncbi:MAG: TolC family protein [Candidatus Sulfotelmatobacter sp.]|jgi:outer membrane protein